MSRVEKNYRLDCIPQPPTAADIKNYATNSSMSLMDAKRTLTNEYHEARLDWLMSAVEYLLERYGDE